MAVDRFFLVPMAVGHLALFILAVNIVHGLGHPERFLNRAKVVFLLLFALISSILAAEAVNGSIDTWSWPSRIYGIACLLTGLVFFPLATLRLHHRPKVPNLRSHERIVDLKASLGFAALAGSGRHRWLLRLPRNESLRFRCVEWELPIPGLPRALDGLSLLHLSDLHLSTSFDRSFFEAVIEHSMSAPSDLLAFTGDLLDDDRALEWVVPLLSRLRGGLGAFAILGNHDLQHDPERLRRLVQEAGLTDLEGRWALVEFRGTRIALGGSSYPWGPELALGEIPSAAFRIYLSHTPDRFYWAERAGFELMLSGHNHGGQVRLPLVGPLFMPSRYSRRFDRGFFRKRNLTMHVSQGIAGKHPIRYGCLPEVGRIILRASSPQLGRPRPNALLRGIDRHESEGIPDGAIRW
jgi:predicted MPP superfamily phosphohydrolase